jgi:rhodanese-related sulfurtransferase
MVDLLIRPSELTALLATPAAPVIIDVRRRKAFDEAGRVIATGTWRDHATAKDWARALPPDAPVVCYCVHGHGVSQSAVAVLRELGIPAQALAGGFEGWVEAGGATILKSALPGRVEGVPSRWVTRVRPKIDRIACPWLIRRFIDRQAQFLYVEPKHVEAVAKETGAIPYDIEGVHFTHRGAGSSFDALIEDFGIRDLGLDRIAPIVRGADTGRFDLAPEAAGLLAVSLGISALSGGDDHAALARGFAVYDALYAWARHAASETHGWPPAKT